MKVLNITFGLLIAVVAVAGAQAGPAPTQPTAVERIIAQEDYKGVRASTQPTAVDRIIAQEDYKGVRASTQPTAVDRIIAQEDYKGVRQSAQPTAVDRIIAQEDYKGVRASAEPTAVDRILAQEQGRHGDLRVFGPGVAPVQIVQRTAGGFNWADAGIGGVAALALALLTAAGLAVRHNRHGARA